jgi:hypothetical protein
MTEAELERADVARKESLKLRQTQIKSFPHRVVPNITPGCDPNQTSRFPQNRIKTTKYNVFNFLPIQIFI